ncbi:Putative tRNA pseudouridine synthase Pus10 [Seminavis robusta]|uniref:tRNA pseudouridine(55) synthase n=1 Tax=Seminavis robusta TaxID=568900 RepID=A0A9N8DJM7_9STRA|nr:Putative tRNA pseudouridine synthase Pus10 [Seminavis robusta]|eukprot:Sro189_g081610.1 Putative tRNA pseudouridine synthase Pus10 (592) ;mRNA; r:79969-81744
MATSTNSEPCPKCQSFLEPSSKETENNETAAVCPICLGLFSTALTARLEQEIRQACHPYGGTTGNKFSRHKDPPVLSVPGDIAVRYHVASLQHPKATPTYKFVKYLKQFAQETITNILLKVQQQEQEQQAPSSSPSYPDCVTKEEQGYLALQVIVAASSILPRPPNQPKSQNRNKKRRKFHHQPYETQGGHPRSNLDETLGKDASILPLWTVTQATEWADKKKKMEADDWFLEGTKTQPHKSAIRALPDTTNTDDSNPLLHVHVALWRRPFLVKGNYTKTRRDVSQSPFFIDVEVDQNTEDNSSNNNNRKRKQRQRLGVTSIEELILPTIVKTSGGISTLNNSSDQNTNVRFGMAKFHASGREDMDVKMILPVHHDNSKNISGRPFCCEIIDALKMPTVADLKQVVESINHSTCLSEATGTTETTSTSTESLPLLPTSSQYYGRSPLGVGVDSLSFAPTDNFKNLQSETESKSKYYACLCWSQQPLPPLDVLQQRLADDTLFKLQIQQKTPIRVLHRRANAVRTRHILSCHGVHRLDDHYFRIHISTDAGTYVKEFCHGDLGRTQPNVSSLLGGGSKIDILELDCEGIQID